MTLWTPSNSWNFLTSNYDTHPYAFPGPGINVTPGASNSKGSYTEVLDAALVTRDCYMMSIILTNSAESGVARDVAVDIAIDTTDTSTYTILIGDLLCPCPSPGVTGSTGTSIPGGWEWTFPVYIPAGTQVGARAQTSSATANTVNVGIKVWGAPSRPELVRAGSKVDTFGFNSGTTDGTAITASLSSEGTYTDISGADTTTSHFYWDFGIGLLDASIQSGGNHIDMAIGDGTNFKDIIRNSAVMTNTAEQTARLHHHGAWIETPAGVRPYLRISTHSTGNAPWSGTAYAVRS